MAAAARALALTLAAAWLALRAAAAAAGGGVTSGVASGAASGLASAAEGGVAVARARCAARCLGLRLPRGPPGAESRGSLDWCRRDAACAQCLRPCLEPEDADADAGPTRRCHEFCEGPECVTSCEFLASVRRVKQGACPAPARARGFAAACVESCEADGECAGARKCCGNGCGHTCQAPRALHRGVPLKPRPELRLAEPPPPGRPEVAWASPRFNVSLEPVVYVLQRRWNPGPHPSEDQATGWDTVAQTTEEHARVPDLRPGRWYQFRVAAVNAHGTRGFTAPSKHFRSARAPAAPAAPTRLRVGNWTSDADGRVGATVTWDGPAGDTDVPVRRFRARWSPGSGPGGTARRATTEDRSLTLAGLTPGRVYTLRLRAEASWGRTRLRGDTATLRFTAGSHPTPGPAHREPED